MIDSGSDLLEFPMSPEMLSFASIDFLSCEKDVISYSITLVDLSQSKASMLFASKSMIIAMSFSLYSNYLGGGVALPLRIV